MLIVENLTKEFNNVIAVNNLSFTVEEGRIFGMLGPNGAGKTTTIRTVLNIIKPSAGRILFKDKPITDEFFNIIGYLPEERGLYKKAKVIDVIVYFAQLKNLSKERAITKAKEWMQKLEIEHYSGKRIEELSKGNQQKIQFITSVIHDPELLILDEPFSGFDPLNQALIKELILSFVTSGKIIILSTHQMETAEKLCPDILLIDKGMEVYKGSLSSLKKRFGINSIKIEFNGDGKFIDYLPMVQNVDRYSNYAEIQLKDNFHPSEFLKILTSKIEISHFSLIEPTLNKIFIDLIKQNQNQPVQ
jgi:ABC-2 type transport system ATP-binding protein